MRKNFDWPQAVGRAGSSQQSSLNAVIRLGNVLFGVAWNWGHLIEEGGYRRRLCGVSRHLVVLIRVSGPWKHLVAEISRCAEGEGHSGAHRLSSSVVEVHLQSTVLHASSEQ